MATKLCLMFFLSLTLYSSVERFSIWNIIIPLEEGNIFFKFQSQVFFHLAVKVDVFELYLDQPYSWDNMAE